MYGTNIVNIRKWKADVRDKVFRNERRSTGDPLPCDRARALPSGSVGKLGPSDSASCLVDGPSRDDGKYKAVVLLSKVLANVGPE